MKQATNKPSTNRVDAALAVWEERQQGYMHTFGPDLMRDRDFLKAKYQVLQQILKTHTKSNLSFDEQISRRILRGQVRQLNRRIYPNPVIRLLRNTAVLIGKLLIIPFNLGTTLEKDIAARRANNQPVYSLTNNHQTQASEVLGPAKETNVSKAGQFSQKNGQQQKSKVGFAVHQQNGQVVARKTPNQNREVLPDTPGKGRKL